MIDNASVQDAFLIRAFEERLLKLFTDGQINGTVHTCVGQEFTGVAVARCISTGDIIVTNHRGHGHFLAKTRDAKGLMAEIMGRSTGICGGVGGSQHLFANDFFSNGIQSGMMPIAAGMAYSFNLEAKNNVVITFVGDGTLGEGQLYETLNIISSWNLPVVIVVENNQYAQSTRTITTTAGSIAGRAAAFAIHYFSTDTWDLEHLFGEVAQAIDYVKMNRKPCLIEVQTYRLNAHSKGDDNRDESEIEAFRKKDFLQQLLESEKTREIYLPMANSAREVVEAAVQEASGAPVSSYSPQDYSVDEQVQWSLPVTTEGRCSDLIYSAFREAMAADKKIILVGEDIEGPYGGAFKVTRDLNMVYPGRVRNTPIAEGLIIGLATGLALSGYHPIAEIMFGDFMTLTFDQLMQHACKFREMYNRKVNVPLIIRTPMGGRRGYGPTHSQSIEKFFLGIPGLTVLALNNRISPLLVYRQLLKTVNSPVLVIENKILYTRFFKSESEGGFEKLVSDEPFPCFRMVPRGIQPQVTLVCYGGMLEETEAAMFDLFREHDILCELFCPTQIVPLNIVPIEESVRLTERLLIAEEGPNVASFGSELVARLAERGVQLQNFKRLGYNGIIPSCFDRETSLLPGRQQIIDSIRQMVN